MPLMYEKKIPVADKYHIKDAILKPAAHHESFEKLWETKWKDPCSKGLYPFMFGSIKDFEPVVEKIIKKGLKEPYDWDEYASMFFPKAQELAAIAAEAERAGERQKASEYYLRSSAVYRIARFPAPRSPKQREAWKLGKEVFYKGAALLEHPIHEVHIPHTVHRAPNDHGATIPANLLVPPSASPARPAPLLLIMTGLDGYRTELAVWQRGFAERGVATLVVEIPGTGDSPVDARDPRAPDRQWSSVLDWVAQQRRAVDAARVVVWGFSTGGFYALRAAHTHAPRLLGAVSLGGGAHHMFDADWLARVNALEYPFDLADTLAFKFGYSSTAAFAREARARFSLLEDGTLDGGESGRAVCCANTLLVNGTGDEIFPIEDMHVALEHGAPKLARMVRGKKHMGEPDSFFIILKWIHDLLGLDGDIMAQMKGIPTKTKY